MLVEVITVDVRNVGRQAVAPLNGKRYGSLAYLHHNVYLS
jgi:hypothetical protein